MIEDRTISRQEALFNFFYTMFKRKYLIIVVFIITFSGVMLGTYLSTPLWKVEAKLLIEANPKQQLKLFNTLETPAKESPPTNIVNNILEILTSQKMAENVVIQFDREKMTEERKENPKKLRDKLKVWIYQATVKPVIDFINWVLNIPPEKKNYFSEAVEDVRQDLEDIEASEDSSIIILGMWGESPQLANDMANFMAQNIVDVYSQIYKKPTVQMYKFVEEELHKKEEDLHRAEKAVMLFKEKHAIVAPGEEAKLLVGRMSQLKSNYNDTSMKVDETNKELKEINRQLQGYTEKETLTTVIAVNPVVVEIKSTLRTLEGKMASLLLEKKENHIEVKRLKTKIEQNKAKLKTEMKKVVENKTERYNPIHANLTIKLLGVQTNKYVLDMRKAGLENAIDKLQQEIKARPSAEIKLASLINDMNLQTALYSNLKSKLEQLKVLVSTPTSDVSIKLAERANVYSDETQTWPSWPLTVIIGMFGSIGLALFLALFVEYWDTSFKTIKELEQSIDIPILGSSSYAGAGTRLLQRGYSRRLVTTGTQNNGYYRRINRGYNDIINNIYIQNNIIEEKIFLISSANFGEGKTTLAINMATVMADREKKVLVVDANFRKPDIQKRLKKSRKLPGFIEAIQGETDMNNAIIKGKFDVLPAGDISNLKYEPFDLLSFNQLPLLLNEMRSLYDVVLIDSPTMKAYKDTYSLIPLVDGVILVVEANRTQNRMMSMAINRIVNLNGRLKGVVLNKQKNYIPSFICEMIK